MRIDPGENTTVTAAINTAVRDVLSIATLVGSMIYLDPYMSLIVLGVYPIAALLIWVGVVSLLLLQTNDANVPASAQSRT